MFWKSEKLYRVEITEDIQYIEREEKDTGKSWADPYLFSNPLEFTRENGILRYKAIDGVIQKGIKGDIIVQWGAKYFSPDEDQPGIERFTPFDNPLILVPYRHIQNHYVRIEES